MSSRPCIIFVTLLCSNVSTSFWGPESYTVLQMYFHQCRIEGNKDFMCLWYSASYVQCFHILFVRCIFLFPEYLTFLPVKGHFNDINWVPQLSRLDCNLILSYGMASRPLDVVSAANFINIPSILLSKYGDGFEGDENCYQKMRRKA